MKSVNCQQGEGGVNEERHQGVNRGEGGGVKTVSADF